MAKLNQTEKAMARELAERALEELSPVQVRWGEGQLERFSELVERFETAVKRAEAVTHSEWQGEAPPGPPLGGSFTWAMRAVAEGKRARRRSWVAEDLTVGLGAGGYLATFRSGRYAFPDGNVCRDDILATDWEVVG